MSNYDIELEHQFSQLLELLILIQKKESDFYKKGLLKRIEFNIMATRNLVENSFLLDGCASIRISVDHCSRLYQYAEDPSSITTNNKTAFQMLGHGPGTAYTFEALGVKKEFGLLFSVLCSFVHPDIMALVISLTEDDKNTILLKVVLAMGLLMSFYILLKTYPEHINDEIEEDVMRSAESVQTIFIEAIISNVTPENVIGISNIPNKEKLFAKKIINDYINELLAFTEEGPQKIIEVIKNILVR